MPSQPLSDYEAAQVALIAAWKGRRPGFLGRAVGALKWPLDRVFETVIPAGRAKQSFERLHRAADWHEGRDAIERALGIEHLAALRDGPLERCDQAVRKLKDLSREVVTGGSLLANAGGIATELLELPVEIMLALQTVHRVAACYGYALDRPEDETIVLAIVGLAMLDDPGERIKARRLIRELEERACPRRDEERLVSLADERLEDEVGDQLVESVSSTLIEEKLGESIPFLGAALGVVLDNAFIAAVEEAAQRTFQERRLREHGKLDEIAPVETPRTVASLGESLARGAYSTTYAISFGVVFPAALVARSGGRWLPAPAVDGLAGGAQAAARDADRLLAGIRGQPDPVPQPG